MIWIAIWFTLAFVNAVSIVMDRVRNRKDLGSFINVVMLGVAVWGLLDAINTEFLTP